MRRLTKALLLLSVASGLATMPTGLVACGEEKGGLMLAISTDMRAPKDVNVVSVAIQVGPEIKYNFVGRVTPEGEVLLPATLAIVEPANQATPIRVRVIAFKETQPRVLRDVTTTAPTGGRVALLRVPLSFINDGSARGALPEGNLPLKAQSLVKPQSILKPLADPFNPFGAEVSSICTNFEETMIDGECRSSVIDSATLPDYSDDLVFPAGRRDALACFDAKTCLVGWREAAVDLEACSAPKGTEPVTNVTLLTGSTGDCNENGRCFVPIDKADPRDPLGSGWREEGDRIFLTKGICKKLREGGGITKLGLAANTACGVKSNAVPVCNGVSGNPAPIADGGTDGGGGDGGLLPLPPGVEKVALADMASGVAVYPDRVYYGAKDGLYVAPTGQAPQLVPQSPRGPFTGPWFVAQAGLDLAFGLGQPINATGDVRAYVLRDMVPLKAVPFNNSIGGVIRGAAISSNHSWYAVNGPGITGGNIYSDGTSQADPGLFAAKSVSAVAYAAPDTLFVGLPDGVVDPCDGQTGSSITCSTPGPTDTSSPVEGIGTTPGASDQAFSSSRRFSPAHRRSRDS